MKLSKFFLVLIFTCGLTLTYTQDDPSVPDADDLNLIDDYIKQTDKNKKDDNDGNQQSPSRGSLDKPSTPSSTTPTTTTTTFTTETPPNVQSRKNQKGESCKCVKYFLCDLKNEHEDTTTTTSSPSTPKSTIALPSSTEPSTTTTTEATTTEDMSTSGSQNILGVVDIRNSGLGGNNNSSVNGSDSCPDDVFDMCCPINDIKEQTTTTPTTTTSITTTTTPTPTTTTTKIPYTPSTSGRHFCGHRNQNGVGPKMTSVAPGEAQFGEFPWTVAVIQLEQNEDNITIHKYVGGGSILHPQVVLTAAHNVLGKSKANLQVRLGEWDTQTNDEPYPSQDRAVRKVIIHERYVKETLYNDVALLILEEEARIAPNVDTICLPPVPKKGKKPINFDDQICYSAGWGKDNFGVEGRYSEVLKKVTIPVINHDKCQKELEKSPKLPGFRLDKSFMCAGGGGENREDTCKGDGGSPLVCSLVGEADGQEHYVQVGSVSWGLGCKTAFPGVYADIQFVTPWILKTMEKEEMSTEYCTL